MHIIWGYMKLFYIYPGIKSFIKDLYGISQRIVCKFQCMGLVVNSYTESLIATLYTLPTYNVDRVSKHQHLATP